MIAWRSKSCCSRSAMTMERRGEGDDRGSSAARSRSSMIRAMDSSRKDKAKRRRRRSTNAAPVESEAIQAQRSANSSADRRSSESHAKAAGNKCRERRNDATLEETSKSEAWGTLHASLSAAYIRSATRWHADDGSSMTDGDDVLPSRSLKSARVASGNGSANEKDRVLAR
eukprot:6192430-Pleurochrysis_carterae.AAC.2